MSPQTCAAEVAADQEIAEADAIVRRHREWVAAGRPGALPHEAVMAEFLRA